MNSLTRAGQDGLEGKGREGKESIAVLVKTKRSKPGDQIPLFYLGRCSPDPDDGLNDGHG